MATNRGPHESEPHRDNHSLTELRTLLAEFYPDVDLARVVVSDAGLEPTLIKFDERAIVNWFNVLNEAVRTNRLDRLLEVVCQSPYGEHPRFRAIVQALQESSPTSPAGGRLAAPPAESMTTNQRRIRLSKRQWTVLVGVLVTVVGLAAGTVALVDWLRKPADVPDVTAPVESSAISSTVSNTLVAIVPSTATSTATRAPVATESSRSTLPTSQRTLDAVCTSAPGRILFASDRDGDLEIYVMNPDGTGQQQLTQNADVDNSPHWGPNQSQIVFVSNRDGQDDLYVMDANGQNVRRLTTETGDDPVWSPDGTRIAFSSKQDGNWEIYVINPDGTNLQRLTSNLVWDSRPSWSPDSSKIVYSSRSSGNNTAGPWDLHTVEADGTQDTILVSNGSRNNRPAWSPDGQSIAYPTDRHGNWEIYTTGVDGGNPIRLTSDVADDTDVTWSPDSQCLAFVTDRTGNKEIYAMDREGNQLRNLTKNAHKDEHPAWAQ